MRRERRLLEIVRGGAAFSVREAVRRSGLGEFEGLRLLYQLAEKGLVTVEEAPGLRWEAILGEMLTIFNGAL